MQIIKGKLFYLLFSEVFIIFYLYEKNKWQLNICPNRYVNLFIPNNFMNALMLFISIS